MSDGTLDRRTILVMFGAVAAGVGGAVVIVPFLKRGPRAGYTPDGIAMARELGVSCVVVAVPDNEDEMIRLSNGLGDRLKSENPRVREAFAAAVWTCVPAAFAALQTGRREPLLRLDAEGRVTEALDPGFSAFESDEGFLNAVAPFAEREFPRRIGEAWDRLAPDDPARRWIVDLGAPAHEARDAAEAGLRSRSRTIFPLIVDALRRAPDDDAVDRCFRLLAAQTRLPFGTNWVNVGACSSDPRRRPRNEGTFACGIAIVRERDRRLLQFLTWR